MPPRRVALVTYRDQPTLTADDRLLLPEFEQRGVEAIPMIWDDPGAAWDTFDCVIVRSCWDYHQRIDLFRAWLDRLESCGARVFNPLRVLRDNLHKGYLRRLGAAGVATVPTAWIPRGAPVDLVALLRARAWPRAVVKPAISAGAYRTWMAEAESAATTQAQLDELVAQGDVLVQPFLPAVETQGELSLTFLGGTYSHALVKRPRAGEFRVQAEFGGDVRALKAPRALREQCRRILELVDGPWLYARVDGIEIDGVFTLMELELIEPELFLALDAAAPARFVDALWAQLQA